MLSNVSFLCPAILLMLEELAWKKKKILKYQFVRKNIAWINLHKILAKNKTFYSINNNFDF